MVRDFYVLALASIRAVLPDLPILLHDSFHGDMWAMMLKYFPNDNVYMDTHLYHGFNPSDIGASHLCANPTIPSKTVPPPLFYSTLPPNTPPQPPTRTRRTSLRCTCTSACRAP